MSAEHPIVAITGSSGSGVTAVTQALEHIIWRVRARGVYIQGNAFHRYDRKNMKAELRRAELDGRRLSHFGPEGNMLDKLDSLFFEYAAVGRGLRRYYLHSKEHAESFDQKPGTFTSWAQIEEGSDLLIYKGLHGGAVHEDIDLSQYPDLLIGMVPNLNLEWMRKLTRDTTERGYSPRQVRKSILRRLPDYIDYIAPQFSRTHINFQTIATIETSDPFNPGKMPNDEDCYIVIHAKKPGLIDFPGLSGQIPNSFMTTRNSIVIPGGKRMMAIETIFTPIIRDLVEQGRKLRGDLPPPADYRGEFLGLI